MTDDLKGAFEERWSRHIKPESNYKCSVWTPFWHMGYEKFWDFVPHDGISSDFIKTLADGHTASIGKMRQYIQYAKFDDDLFRLLQNEDSRKALDKTLISTWLINE